MKNFLAVLAFLFSSSLYAQVMVVKVYQPLSGGMPQTFEYAAESKAIVETLGAQVTIGVTGKGNMEIFSFFPNWESYGQFQMALANNESWLALMAKVNENPSFTQIDNRLLTFVDPVDAAPGPGSVYETRKIVPGKGPTAVPDMIASARHVKSIFETNGGNVALLQDALRNLYFINTYPDAATWGKTLDTPNPELQEYLQSLDSSDPASPVIVDITTGTVQ